MKIRNLETGEITEVNPQDAGQYGITPEDITSFKKGQPYNPGGTSTTNGSPYNESQKIPVTNKPLGAFYSKVETTPLETTKATPVVASTDIKSQLSAVESKRQADMRTQPDKAAEIKAYWDSEIEKIDPGGVERTRMLDKPTDVPKTAGQVNEVTDTVGNIDKVLGKDLKFVGFLGNKISSIPGTEAYVTARQVQQIKDQLSLASVGKLKGQGQVSDAERSMLANASTSLDLGMTQQAFRDELFKVKKILNRGIGVETPDPPPPDSGKNDTSLKIGGNPVDFGGTDRGNESFANLQQSTLLAKQALTEKDPEKKRQLLADSRALSKIGSDQNQKLTINPVVHGLGKVQEALGNSEALPITGSIIGSKLLPIPGVGAGIGAGLGTFGQQMLKVGGKEAFLPSDKTRQKASEEISKRMVGYGALDLALWGGGKAIKFMSNPFKAVGDFRAAKIAEASGIKLNTSVIISDLEKGAENLTATTRPGYLKFLASQKQIWANKLNLTVDEAVELNSAAGDAFTAAGKVGKAASAKFNEILGNSIKSQLRIDAPAVAKANQIFRMAYGAKDLIKKYGPGAVIGGLIYKTLNK